MFDIWLCGELESKVGKNGLFHKHDDGFAFVESHTERYRVPPRLGKPYPDWSQPKYPAITRLPPEI